MVAFGRLVDQVTAEPYAWAQRRCHLVGRTRSGAHHDDGDGSLATR